MRGVCEICFSKNLKKTYLQKFYLAGNKKVSSYHILCCKKCGFMFASNIPYKSQIEDFYKDNIKYTFAHDRGSIPEFDNYAHSKTFKFSFEYLKKNKKLNKNDFEILDIGSATGDLLNVYKKHGFKNVSGLDPAPECRVIAKKLYNINIFTSPLLKFKSSKKYSLVILSSVLEHMDKLDQNLKKIADLTKENGYALITIPDVGNFDKPIKEPFLEFSTEHINYFTRLSMINLMSQYGFSNKAFLSHKLKGFGGYALETLWQLDNKNGKIKKDESGKRNIKKYISNSLKLQKKYQITINRLNKSQEEIIIWGMGSLTSRLFADTNLLKANIIKIVDSNQSFSGKKINGIKIFSPDIIQGSKTTILISSINYSDEIENVLKTKYKYKGEIIKF